mmetsp:Transcript_89413/g.239149  ORF Transcript_89413/g.239149 Transcript_89413/m.239149 type:complete len:89 (-) Transcript_89413:36-302(-)
MVAEFLLNPIRTSNLNKTHLLDLFGSLVRKSVLTASNLSFQLTQQHFKSGVVAAHPTKRSPGCCSPPPTFGTSPKEYGFSERAALRTR